MTRILTDQIYVMYDQVTSICKRVSRLLGFLGNSLKEENVEELYFEKRRLYNFLESSGALRTAYYKTNEYAPFYLTSYT